MKRRFVLLLVLLVVVVGSSVIVSCDDTCEDLYNNMKLQQISDKASLEEALSKQMDYIEFLRDSLNNELKKINSCSCDGNKGCSCDGNKGCSCDDNKGCSCDGNKGCSCDNSDLIAQINRLDSIITRGDSLVSKQDMKNYADSLARVQEIYIQNTINNAKNEVAQTIYEQTINMIDSAMNTIKPYDDSLILAKINKLEQTIIDVKAYAYTVNVRVDSLGRVTTQLRTDLDAVNNRLVFVGDSLGQVTNNLRNDINIVNVRLVSMGDSLKVAYETAALAMAKSDANEIYINNLNTTVENHTIAINKLTLDLSALSGRVDGMETTITGMQTSINGINTKITNLETTLTEEILTKTQEAKDYADTKMQEAKDYADAEIATAIKKLKDELILTINTKVGALTEAFQAADADLQKQIDALRTDVTDLQTRMTDVEKAIIQINKQIEAIQKKLASMVTGITIQQVTNPAFGSVSLPMNINTNVLIAYYGAALNNVEFPTYKTGNNVKNSSVLTSADMSMLKASDDFEQFMAYSGEQLLSDKEDNAGTVYMTINPNTADMTGLNVSLENSQAVASGVVLQPIKKSDKTLTFGVSRAADNGFYEAAARVNDPAAVQKININAGALKENVKDILKNRQNADFKGIAGDMYDLVKGASLDANALKCTDADGRSVYSQYAIAATAIKPLSLSSYEDLNYKYVPGYQQATNLLNRLSNSIQGRIKVVMNKVQGSALVKNIQNLEIKNIEIKDLSEEKLGKFIITMDTTVNFTIDGLKYHLQLEQNVDVPVKFATTVNVPIHIDADVRVDLSTVTVKVPTVVIETKLENKDDGSATLLIPVRNGSGEQIGTAQVPLDDVKVKAEGTLNGGNDLTLNGTPVAHIKYDKDVPVEIVVDETVHTTVKIDKLLYFGDNGTDKITRQIRFAFHYDLRDAAQDLWGEAQDALGGVNDMLADTRTIVGNINKILAQLNDFEQSINSTIQGYVNKAQSYLVRINNKLVGMVNATNTRFQPMMFVSTNQGSKLLSEAKSYPTKISASDIKFYATTWNFELLCPVFKKHVAVTNVFKGNKSAQGGDADCKARLMEVNGSIDMNNVFDGSDKVVNANNMKSGYTYEVAYSALDFHGKISVKKFYVAI